MTGEMVTTIYDRMLKIYILFYFVEVIFAYLLTLHQKKSLIGENRSSLNWFEH